MFKKSKSKVLVDYASEEDDMSWHYDHSYKDKDLEGGGGGEEEEEEEEAESPVSKESKVKKIRSKKERRDKKMFSSKDDEHLLITGVKLTDRRGSHKKIKDEEKEKEKEKDNKEKKEKTEKSLCFWESVTMTMKQITPTRKPAEKMEGWEPPQVSGDTIETPTEESPEVWRSHETGDDSPASLPESPVLLPEALPSSWAGLGLEEDSSRYANLSDSKDSAAVRWTTRAKGKLAGISRRSRGIVSESSWEGFK